MGYKGTVLPLEKPRRERERCAGAPAGTIQPSGFRDMSVRWTLKRSTAEQHHLLDGLVSRLGCFDDLDGYGRWLAAMHGFYDRIEQALAGHDATAIIGPARMRERIDALAADLADIGVRGRGAPAHMSLRIADGSEMLGVLYVTEGASLGARLLVARAEALGCDEQRGARFLSAEARSTASWRGVMAALQAADAEPGQLERMIAASRRTFDLAAACLGDCHAA